MAIDIQLKTVIELLFFALLLITAVYIFATFYNALFVPDNSLEDVKHRIEFTVCGGFATIQEGCPADEDNAHIYMFEAPHGPTSRLIVFEREGQSIPGNEMLVLEDSIDVFGFDTGLNLPYAIQPRLQARSFYNPCDGPCVCMIDLSSFDQITKSMCLDLEFEEHEIQIFSHSAASGVQWLTEKVSGGIRSLFQDAESDEYEPFNSDAISATPPYIAPYRSNWVFLPAEKYVLNYFLIYMYYNAENSQLLITQYNPDLEEALAEQ